MKCLLFFLLFSLFAANAQEHKTEINGVVKDAKGKPVAFVNIGVMGKGFGGMSDEAGKFCLFVPDSLLDDQLTISHIAYKKYSSRLRELAGSSVTVVLEDSLLVLPEVSISPMKGKWISNKGIRVPGGVMATDSIGSLGEEIGISVKLDKEGLLEQIRLPIFRCGYDSVLVRINLYHLSDEMNPELLPVQPIYQTIRKMEKKEKVLFTYDTPPLIPAGNIRVGFEIVRVYGKGKLFFPLYSTSSLHRSVSLDTYKKAPFGIKASVYVRQ